MKNKLTKKFKVTYTLVVLNILIQVLTLFGLTPSVLGISPYYIFGFTHQYYRLFTHMFSHFGIMHLVCNMVALITIGLLLEPMLGSNRFAALYLISGTMQGIIVAIISKVFSMNILAAGASGAIFALMGYLLVLSIKLKNQNKILGSIFRSIIITLILSSLGGGSLLCHIAGLVSGIIVSIVLFKIPNKIR